MAATCKLPFIALALPMALALAVVVFLLEWFWPWTWDIAKLGVSTVKPVLCDQGKSEIWSHKTGGHLMQV